MSLFPFRVADNNVKQNVLTDVFEPDREGISMEGGSSMPAKPKSFVKKIMSCLKSSE